MNAPYPNRAQWVGIYATVLVACHIWLERRLSDWLPDPNRSWGVYGYLSSAFYEHPTRLAVSALVVGALLVWQLSRWQFRRRGTLILLGVAAVFAIYWAAGSVYVWTVDRQWLTPDTFVADRGDIFDRIARVGVDQRQAVMSVAVAGVLTVLLVALSVYYVRRTRPRA